MNKPSRPVSGFVPIGELAGAVPGIVPRGRAMSAETRHHFTTLRQVNQLIEASEADADMGFMARLLTLCSLPRTNPKQRNQYVRRNGPYALYMTAGAGNRLPFGNLPRLLMAWVCSEAVRTQRRDLVLGRSLYEFMHKLGMEDRSGGRHGERARLKNQMTRLFRCSVQIIYTDGEHEVTVSSFLADRTEYWWNTKRPTAPVLWDSTIELGEKFFQEIIAHPIPLDLNTLRAMKRSSLGLDLYFWLVYRTFTLKAPLTLSWRQLYRQFGANPSAGTSTNGFRASCLREISYRPLRGRYDEGPSKGPSISDFLAALAASPLLATTGCNRGSPVRPNRPGPQQRLRVKSEQTEERKFETTEATATAFAIASTVRLALPLSYGGLLSELGSS